MKRFLIIAICVLPVAASANDNTTEPLPKEPVTKLQAFLAKKGRLIVKDFYEMGKVTGRFSTWVKFDAVVIYTPGEEGQRVRGLSIEVGEASGYTSSRNTSFLDLEEVESLSQALEYMLELSEKWRGANKEQYTEVVFSTKDNFRIGFYQKGTEQHGFASSGYVGKTSCFFPIQSLNMVKVIVDSSLKLLYEE